MHRWLRGAVYDDKGFLELFSVSLIEGAVCLAAMLFFAIPKDLRRFRQMKYGRVLRGPVMLSPSEFNKAAEGRRHRFQDDRAGEDDEDSRTEGSPTLPNYG